MDIKDKMLEAVSCPDCGGYGYTVTVEPECCMRGEYSCCGVPKHKEVQVGCAYCNTKGQIEVEITSTGAQTIKK